MSAGPTAGCMVPSTWLYLRVHLGCSVLLGLCPLLLCPFALLSLLLLGQLLAIRIMGGHLRSGLLRLELSILVLRAILQRGNFLGMAAMLRLPGSQL